MVDVSTRSTLRLLALANLCAPLGVATGCDDECTETSTAVAVVETVELDEPYTIADALAPYRDQTVSTEIYWDDNKYGWSNESLRKHGLELTPSIGVALVEVTLGESLADPAELKQNIGGRCGDSAVVLRGEVHVAFDDGGTRIELTDPQAKIWGWPAGFTIFVNVDPSTLAPLLRVDAAADEFLADLQLQIAVSRGTISHAVVKLSDDRRWLIAASDRRTAFRPE